MGSRYPFPPYPNGWFRVAYSHELEVRGVTPLYYFGRDLRDLSLQDLGLQEQQAPVARIVRVILQ